MLLLNHQVRDKRLLKLDKIQLQMQQNILSSVIWGVFVTCIYCKEEFS